MDGPCPAREPTAIEGALPARRVGRAVLVHGDCLAWLAALPAQCLHAVVTDPPYAIKEYEPFQLARRGAGTGGVWRRPPVLDGRERSPLPRFTVLSRREREALSVFFSAWSTALVRALRPGAHVFVASSPMLALPVFSAITEGGLEYRGEVIRIVRTLRGGDRPKGSELDFPDVSSMPRGCYEPWGVFRRPIPHRMTVSDCLRTWQTGALRRTDDGHPFEDVVVSERTPRRERSVADHPSLKPQSFLRLLVRAALPLGEGVVADPFMGSGSTLAAAEALGLASVGVERHDDYYAMSLDAVARLARM